jgi:hypothetical protein
MIVTETADFSNHHLQPTDPQLFDPTADVLREKASPCNLEVKFVAFSLGDCAGNILDMTRNLLTKVALRQDGPAVIGHVAGNHFVARNLVAFQVYPGELGPPRLFILDGRDKIAQAVKGDSATDALPTLRRVGVVRYKNRRPGLDSGARQRASLRCRVGIVL